MSDGKLRLSASGESLARDGQGNVITGFGDNMWTALEWLHVVWIKEHNYIVEQIAREQPSWDDERLFQHGRIVLSAAINKVHTVEWTPTLFDNPISTALQNSIFPGTEDCRTYVSNLRDAGFGRRNSLVMKGMCRLLGQVITQQRKELTFGWTNSFISVYRMHQLLPDRIERLCTLKEMIDHDANGATFSENLELRRSLLRSAGCFSEVPWNSF